jgi:hypothetical protein
MKNLLPEKPMRFDIDTFLTKTKDKDYLEDLRSNLQKTTKTGKKIVKTIDVLLTDDSRVCVEPNLVCSMFALTKMYREGLVCEKDFELFYKYCKDNHFKKN